MRLYALPWPAPRVNTTESTASNNFWSSTCTACVREMPAIETAYRDLGARVAFVGIDVSDTGSAARAFASRLKVSYPLVSDASGAVTSAYQIPELPFTVILSPTGVLKTLHPGAMTTASTTAIGAAPSAAQGLSARDAGRLRSFHLMARPFLAWPDRRAYPFHYRTIASATAKDSCRRHSKGRLSPR